MNEQVNEIKQERRPSGYAQKLNVWLKVFGAVTPFNWNRLYGEL